jgi:hypothetical protein
MLLIGVNRSPFTRRVAITLNIYGVPFEQHAFSGFDNRAEVRATATSHRRVKARAAANISAPATIEAFRRITKSMPAAK